jgi:glutamine---fructose-6-phosphate transaminase (isomerizing)
LRSMLQQLFLLSESRGKEAAGIAIRNGEHIRTFKEAVPASAMIRSKAYRHYLDEALPQEPAGLSGLALTGHSRLVTNGRQAIATNNQPAIRDGVVGVHNGIIVNQAAIWAKLDGLKPTTELDTEALLALIGHHLALGKTFGLAVSNALDAVEGTANVLLLSNAHDELVAATNNASLYRMHSADGSVHVFASESYTLERLCKHSETLACLRQSPIERVQPGETLAVSLSDGAVTQTLAGHSGAVQDFGTPVATQANPGSLYKVLDYSALRNPATAKLRRCTACILPETMPFITFDGDGVCNFCHNHEKITVFGRDALDSELSRHRRSGSNQPDCLVGFSGGRDSSYGLHLLKTDLAMTPIAFTYDWGMVTDLARRNQARICGKLGVEHVLISADIAVKRRNIRKNVEAWLRKPDLGMIPLFMAGDKQFYFYANQLMQRTGIKLIVFCENGKLERTHFKSGFCGINEGSRRAFNVSPWEKFKLAAYYGRQYIRNPRYINASSIDTLFGFYSSYLLKHDYIMLFDYLMWEEGEVERTLIGEYDWETAPDTRSTWRIGDGTAAFYNYIYYTMAGFTENDTLRSKQIREGLITREAALVLVAEENKPRWESLEWYAHQIGIDLNEAIRVINSAPRLYAN